MGIRTGVCVCVQVVVCFWCFPECCFKVPTASAIQATPPPRRLLNPDHGGVPADLGLGAYGL